MTKRTNLNKSIQSASMQNDLPDPFPGFDFQPNAKQKVVPSNKNKKSKREISGLKAGNNGVLIHVVLDESSSMNSCREDTINAFNEWLEGQKSQEGECFLTLSKFNGHNVDYIINEKPIQEVEPLTEHTYKPGGSTNLHDAIGDNLKRIDNQLRENRRKHRPGVIVVVLTDGQENSSNKYQKDDIKAMVEDREGKDWLFMFLGANIDAFDEGSGLGFRADTTLQYNTNNMGDTMVAMSSATTRARTAYAAGATGDELYSSTSYTDEERASAISSNNTKNKK